MDSSFCILSVDHPDWSTRNWCNWGKILSHCKPFSSGGSYKRNFWAHCTRIPWSSPPRPIRWWCHRDNLRSGAPILLRFVCKSRNLYPSTGRVFAAYPGDRTILAFPSTSWKWLKYVWSQRVSEIFLDERIRWSSSTILKSWISTKWDHTSFQKECDPRCRGWIDF